MSCYPHIDRNICFGAVRAGLIPCLQMLEELSLEREVIMFDNIGMGNSSKIPNPDNYTFNDLADSIANFIKALQLPQKPDVVG